MDNFTLFIIILFVIACLLPVVLFAGLMILAVTQAHKAKTLMDTIVIPDQGKLRQQFHQLQTQNPEANVEVLVKQIIFAQSVKSGIVGFILGLGGFIAVPFNVGASIRLQASTIHLIAYAYGTDESDEALKKTTYLIMIGNQAVTQASQFGARVLQPFLLQIAGRTFFRSVIESIPLVSSIVGLVLNIIFTQIAGRLAIKWYTNPELQLKTGQVLHQGEALLDQGLLKVASSDNLAATVSAQIAQKGATAKKSAQLAHEQLSQKSRHLDNEIPDELSKKEKEGD